MKVLIAGCGYVGTAVANDLAQNGAEVWGLRRDWSKIEPRPDFNKIEADLLRPDSLRNLPPVDLVLICQSPSRESDTYENTYYQATRNLLEALWGERLKKILLISTTGVYAAKDGSWVDEKNGLLNDSNVHLKAEESILTSRWHGMVLRLGGIYGPGRNRVAAIKSGSFKSALSDEYTNRIHVEDVVSSINLLFEKGKAGQVYLGVDDVPCTQKEFYTWLYGQLSLPLPVGGTDRMRPYGSNKRCSNKKIKRLGLRLKYPSYREGYASFL